MNNHKTNINQDFSGKIPPQAVEVEEAVLGALILEPEAFNSVAGILKGIHFYSSSNQIIFEVVNSIHSERKKIDLLTVTQTLKDRGLLEEIGGPVEITRLTRRVASAAHIEAHARIIIDKFTLRNALTLAREIERTVFETEDVDEVVTKIKSGTSEVEENYASNDTGAHIQPVLKETIEIIQESQRKLEQHKTPGITTGFPSIDTVTGGWRNGNLIVLAARPSVGKSSLALKFLLSAASAGFWCNIFSLEMSKEDLASILIAAECEVYRSNIRDGYLNQTDWKEINQAVARLEKLPIIFKDSAGMNIHHIENTIRSNKKKGRCDFAVIDYLQLVRSVGKKSIREQEIAEISRTLKTIALEYQIPIMALSQLNRIEAHEEPGLINLRESGAIEQDADLVCFLFRPDKDNSITLSIAKHRRGKLGYQKIFHNQGMTRFSENPLFDGNSNSIPYPDSRTSGSPF